MCLCGEYLCWAVTLLRSFTDFIWVSEHITFAYLQCGNLASGIPNPCLVKASTNSHSGLLCVLADRILQFSAQVMGNETFHSCYTFSPCPDGKLWLVAYLKYTNGFIIVYTGRTMEKQTINTIPNLLLEIMYLLLVKHRICSRK